MSDLTPMQPDEPLRFSAAQYLRLVEAGVLGVDDRVELLAGVIVAMAPGDPPHATATMLATFALARALGARAAVRTQCPLVAGGWSVPEPDVAVVPGSLADYGAAHPTMALLVVKVASSSLAQDRLSKSRIYAAAGIPEYWIVNLREGVVEVLRDPDRATALYRDTRTCRPGERIALATLPEVGIDAGELMPPHATECRSS